MSTTPTTPADTFEVDVDDLTIAEVEVFEDLVDLPFDEAFGPGRKKAKSLRALAVVMKRREDPSFSWEDAGALRINLKADEEETPVDPLAPAAGPASA